MRANRREGSWTRAPAVQTDGRDRDIEENARRDSILAPPLRPKFRNRMMNPREWPEAARGGHLRQLHEERPTVGALDCARTDGAPS